MSACSGPRPARLSAATIAGNAITSAAAAQAAAAGASPPARARPAPRRRAVPRPPAPPALGDRVQPRVDRRERSPRSPRPRAGRPAAAVAHDPGHHAGAEALEHRHGRVAIGVVAVDRVDVVAQPHARIRGAHARRREPRRRPSRASPPAPSPPRTRARAAAAGRRRARRASHALGQVVVVVAGDDHDLARPGPAPRRSRRATGAAAAERLAHRARGAARARRRAAPAGRRRAARPAAAPPGGARAQHVRRRAWRAEVQVGDDQRAQRGRLSGLASGRGRQRLADRLGEHEAHVLPDHLELARRRSVPRSRKNSTRRCTSSSGALAPEVIPTTRLPSSHSSRTWLSLSIRCESAPCSRATSTRRLEFDELREPITSTRSHSRASCLTAAWRLVVA